MLPNFEHIGPWEVFLLFLLAISAAFVIGILCLWPMSLIPYLAALVGTTIQIYRNPPEPLPAPVFWVLVVVCFPFTLNEGNLASVLLWGLIISHWSLIVAIFPVIFLLIFTIAWPLSAYLYGGISIPGILCWMGIAYVMLDKIHLLMHPGYWAGWVVLDFGLMLAFAPELPHIWNIVASSLVALMCWLVGPEKSVEHFLLFASTVIPLCILRFLFPFVYIYPETYLFPFNLISHQYKVSSAVWDPLGELENPPNVLCAQCADFTANSKLIMGAFRPLVSLVEWHGVSLSRSSLTGISPCNLCPLLWHSVDSKALGNLQGGEWRVKVWQERPIARYVFAKLYHDDKPVGLRLLIHRGKNFNDPAPSIEASSTGSTAHMSLAKSWLADCQNCHQACDGVGNSPRRPPTRLIHVEPLTRGDGSTAVPTIKLALTDSNDTSLKYLAFSHCWGGSGTFKLLQENYVACEHGIDFSALSKNMRDAIIITRELGYSYIWIDSLCIIQDSAEDWRVEAARMESVYAGATCTLASTGSGSGEDGCFHRRFNHSGLRPCRVGASAVSGEDREWIYVRRDDLSDFRKGVDHAPLNKRGWVLQERLLSRRILHFGAEMLYWECCLRSASELCPAGFVYKQHPAEYHGDFLPPPIKVEPDGSDLIPESRWKRSRLIQRRLPQPDVDLDHDALPSRRGMLQSNRAFMKERRRHGYDGWEDDSSSGRYRTALEQIQDNEFESEGILSFAQCWYAIVEPYTRSSLSFSTDRLIAIQGIVQEVERATNYTFVAGLWREHLVGCLLWFMVQGPGNRLLETTAPKKAAVVQPETNGSAGQGGPEAVEHEESVDSPAQEPPKAPPMAPTWSWVSVSGPVSIDQFPVNSSRKVYTTCLATECSATATTVKPGPAGEHWNAVEGVLEIKAPLTKVTRLEFDDGHWYIYVGSWARRRSARLIPDLMAFAKDVNGTTTPELFCISLLALRRETEMVFHFKTNEVQGIVIRRMQQRDGMPDMYERVGFFSTRLVEGGSWHLGNLKKAPLEKVHVL